MMGMSSGCFRKGYLVIILGTILCLGLMGCGQKPKKIKTPLNPSALALDAREEFVYIACAGSKQVSAWDLKKNRQVAVAEVEKGPLRLYLDSQNEVLLVLCYGSRKMLRFSTPNLKRKMELELPDSPAAWFRDPEKNEEFFCCPGKNVIRHYAGRDALPSIEAGLDPVDGVVQPETELGWIANSKSNDIAIINLTKNSLEKRIAVWSTPIRLLVSPMGDKLYVLCLGKENVPQKSVIQLLDFHYQVAGITWPLDSNGRDFVVDSLGRNLFVLGEKSLRVLSAQSGSVVSEIPVGLDPQQVVVSPDGLRAYVACRGENAVWIYSFSKEQLKEK